MRIYCDSKQLMPEMLDMPVLAFYHANILPMMVVLMLMLLVMLMLLMMLKVLLTMMMILMTMTLL